MNDHLGPYRNQSETRMWSVYSSLVIGYIAYYFCRQNFTEAYGLLVPGLGMDKLAFGAIASSGTLAYAIGKFVTSTWPDRWGGRRTFLWGLGITAVLNITLGFQSTILAFAMIIPISRFFQSLGWGSMVQVVGNIANPARYGTYIGGLTLSYQFGSVLVSLASAWLLSQTNDYRMMFWAPGLLAILVGGGVFFILRDRPSQESENKTIPTFAQSAPRANWRTMLEMLAQPMFLLACFHLL